MSNASEASTSNQQGAKKGKDNNKDMMGRAEEKLVEINISVSASMGTIKEGQVQEQLESKEDTEELHAEM